MKKERVFNFPYGTGRHYIGKKYWKKKNTMHIGQHNILTRMNFTINTRDGRKTFYKHFGNLIEEKKNAVRGISIMHNKQHSGLISGQKGLG
jgi:hypothetical protein